MCVCVSADGGWDVGAMDLSLKLIRLILISNKKVFVEMRLVSC